MHIPDGFLNAPTWITLAAASTVVVSSSLKKEENKLDREQIPLIGMMTTFIFAAQMINFPVAGATSGHLLGGALAAILFGPRLGSIMITAVIVIQALFFQDGGITAIGANVFNTGIVTAFVGYGMFKVLSKFSNRQISFFAIFTSSFISVVVSSVCASIELAISDVSPFFIILKAMVGWHVLIGLGEGIITYFVVRSIAANKDFSLKLQWKVRNRT